MAKKENNADNQQTFQFELQKNEPIVKPNGDRDYFAEYYRTYKNDYIDQYLKAYRELKDVNSAIDKVDGTGNNPEKK